MHECKHCGFDTTVYRLLTSDADYEYGHRKNWHYDLVRSALLQSAKYGAVASGFFAINRNTGRKGYTRVHIVRTDTAGSENLVEDGFRIWSNDRAQMKSCGCALQEDAYKIGDTWFTGPLSYTDCDYVQFRVSDYADDIIRCAKFCDASREDILRHNEELNGPFKTPEEVELERKLNREDGGNPCDPPYLGRALRVYVSSPFYSERQSDMQMRVECVKDFVAFLMKDFDPKDAVFYSPLLQTKDMGMATVSNDYWSDVEIQTMQMYDAVLEYRLPGWPRSRGMERERQYARDLGLPVRCVDARYTSGVTFSEKEAVDAVRGLMFDVRSNLKKEEK